MKKLRKWIAVVLVLALCCSPALAARPLLAEEAVAEVPAEEISAKDTAESLLQSLPEALSPAAGEEKPLPASEEAESAAELSAVSVWDGTVSPVSPSGGVYAIYTAGQLAYIAQLANSGQRIEDTVRLMADIDLNGREWPVIGSGVSSGFRGTFDGNGHTISNLTISKGGTKNVGLFGYASGATFQNVTLTNVNVRGGDYTGALLGYGLSKINIRDCAVEGSVTATTGVGMLVGKMDGSVLRCSAKGTLRSTDSIVSAGSLVGSASATTFTQCWTDVTNTSSCTNQFSSVGGIVAENYKGSITNCYALGNISANCEVGGIIGSASGTEVTCCYYAGTITGGKYKGGIVGSVSTSTSPTFRNCYFNKSGCLYAANNATTYSGITGLFSYELKDAAMLPGLDFNTVWRVVKGGNGGYPFLRWQTFPVESVVITADAHFILLGQTMQLNVEVRPEIAADTSYTLVSSAPAVVSVSATGLLTARSTGKAVITATANQNGVKTDFEVSVLSPAEVPGGFAGGKGTAKEPYLVSTAANLEHLARMTNLGYSFEGEHIRQTADLSLGCSASKLWTPIGASDATAFRGSYDGGGFRVGEVYVDANAAKTTQGLFGTVKGGTISMVKLTNAYFIGGGFVGGIAGYAVDTSILGCQVSDTVTVSGTSYVGGIAGEFGTTTGNTARIAYCTSAAAVAGSAITAGGIVGTAAGGGEVRILACRNLGQVSSTAGGASFLGGVAGMMSEGAIFCCYNKGGVNGGGTVGGIVGSMSGTVLDCYNSASVRSSGIPAGGIVGMLGASGQISMCYNAGRMTAQSLVYECGIVGNVSSGGVVSKCYTQTSATDDILHATSSSLTSRYGLSGWDFDDIWTFDEGGSYAYPVLRVFYPQPSAQSYTYDRAAFSANSGDLVVDFSTYGNVLVGVDELADAEGAMTVESLSSGALERVTLSEDYLNTLSLGGHTFTARFVTGDTAAFRIDVVDTTPEDVYIMGVDDVTVGDSRDVISFRLSVPERRGLCVVIAAYSGDKATAVGRSIITADRGASLGKIMLPHTSATTYKAFLLDSGTLSPITPRLAFSAASHSSTVSGAAAE